MELLKITPSQKGKLNKLGYNATDNTLVVEALMWMRNPKHNISPHYVRCHWSAYCVAEVYRYQTLEEKEKGVGVWFSHGVNSWEYAEYLALDYILSIEE